MRRPLSILIVLVALALAALYLHGNLDRLLYGVGLNFNECARNGLGASFCGKELDEYRERADKAKTESEESQRKLEAEQAKSREEAEASQQKAERESNALLKRSGEEQAEAERHLRESTEEP